MDITLVQRIKRQIELAKNIKAGMTVQQAMVKAGYTPETARQGKNVSKIVRETVDKARLEFAQEYLKTCGRVKINGKAIAKRLSNTIHSRDDFNSTQAIKVHMTYLGKFGDDTNGNGRQGNGNIVVPLQISLNLYNGKKAATDDTNQQKMESDSPQVHLNADLP